VTTSYLTDLLEQPAALQATLDGLATRHPITSITRHLAEGKYRRVVLTGMGSSYQALYPLELRLIGRGLSVFCLETAELIHHATSLIEPHSLIVANSQSGESAEVVQLLAQAGKDVTVIGVTNTEGSILARQATEPVLTRAGEEATVSCKTYISGLAALVWLGDQLTGEKSQFPALAEVPEMVAQVWAGWEASVRQLSGRLADVHNLFLLGRGISLAAACTGALVIKEAARFAAEGMNSAAFRHGPLELVSERTFALVYLGMPATATFGLNARLVDNIALAGGQAQAVGVGQGAIPFNLPACHPSALPILEILPAQMLSLALAQVQGIEAGKFVHASKVTRSE
jgi:glucosamine--fructose-6-phosphate aminotransferase (isomerizing)